MWEELLKALNENPEAQKIAKDIQGKYSALSNEVKTLEGKLGEATQKRDKYKNFTKQVKSKLGIEEGVDLNEETLNNAISSLSSKAKKDVSEVESALKSDISNLEKALAEKANEIDSVKNQFNEQLLNSKLELEIYKTTTGIEAVNKKAHDIIINELRQGAVINDNGIGFVDDTGATLRKDGVPMSLSDRLEQIKNDEDHSFLFKAEVNSGSGLNSSSKSQSSGQNTGELSDFSRQKIEEARKMGVKIPL